MDLAAAIKLARRFEFPNGLIVEYKGKNGWVVDGGKGFGNTVAWSERYANWYWEMMPSNRSDAYIEATRYSLDKALELAWNLDKEEGDVHPVEWSEPDET